MLYILMIAISLSMDAFSLALCIGTINIKYSRMLFFSVVVGIFHFLLPSIGVILGDSLFAVIKISYNPKYITSIIFIILSVFMLYEKSDVKKNYIYNIISLIILAFTVSIDSFIAGVGLNLIDSRHLLYLITFSICSFAFSIIGLIIGKYANIELGDSANKIAIIILITISILNLLKN